MTVRDDCILWTGSKTRDGYGLAEVGDLIGDGKRHRTLAHRAMWWREHGDPGPKVIHHKHTCSRLCINLDHLEAVDKDAHDDHHKILAKCKRGHDRLNPANIWTDANGNGHCRLCWRERRQEKKGQVI